MTWSSTLRCQVSFPNGGRRGVQLKAEGDQTSPFFRGRLLYFGAMAERPTLADRVGMGLLATRSVVETRDGWRNLRPGWRTSLSNGFNFKIGHYPIPTVDRRTGGDLVVGGGSCLVFASLSPVGVRAGALPHAGPFSILNQPICSATQEPLWISVVRASGIVPLVTRCRWRQSCAT